MNNDMSENDILRVSLVTNKIVDILFTEFYLSTTSEDIAKDSMAAMLALELASRALREAHIKVFNEEAYNILKLYALDVVEVLEANKK